MTRVKKQRKNSRGKKEKEKNIYINIYTDRFFAVQNDADCRVRTNDPQPCITKFPIISKRSKHL